MNYKTSSNIAAILWLAGFAAFIYGWVANIITIANSSFSEITGMLVLRIVGIFVGPLGAILGYV